MQLTFEMDIAAASGMLREMRDAFSHAKMIVTVLGSGTSQGVPMIGCMCQVCQSPDARDKRTRSSIFLDLPEAKIMVDTTPDMRQQALREHLDRLDAVLFTHRHADHIMGFDDLRRFCDLRNGPMPVYGSPETMEQLERIFFYAFKPKMLVPGYVHVVPHAIDGPFQLGGLDITPLPVPHGATSTLGFLFSRGGRRLLAYLSDCASVSPEIRKKIHGVEVLIIDGLRDKPHPTHLTVGGAIEVAQEVRAGRSYLTHQTHEKRYVDRMKELPYGIEVAYDGQKLEFDFSS